VKNTTPVAEICLYGTTQTGSGWLACIADGTRMLGNVISAEEIIARGEAMP